MRTICFANQKGGVGKTAASVCLAYSTSRRLCGRVLLLDQDIQGNASARFLNSQQLPLERTVAALYQNNLLQDPDQIIHPTRIEGLDLVPSNLLLASEEPLVYGRIRNSDRLSLFLSSIRDRYTLVLIDCPPSLNVFTTNALLASDGYVIPTTLFPESLDGIHLFLRYVEQIEAFSQTRDLGRIVSHYDQRPLLQKETYRVFMETNEHLHLGTVHHSTEMGEAALAGLTIGEYAPKSRAALEYEAIATRLLERIGIDAKMPATPVPQVI